MSKQLKISAALSIAAMAVAAMVSSSLPALHDAGLTATSGIQAKVISLPKLGLLIPGLR